MDKGYVRIEEIETKDRRETRCFLVEGNPGESYWQINAEEMHKVVPHTLDRHPDHPDRVVSRMGFKDRGNGVYEVTVYYEDASRYFFSRWGGKNHET